MHSHAGTIHVRSWSQAEVRRVCHGVTSDANDPFRKSRPKAPFSDLAIPVALKRQRSA